MRLALTLAALALIGAAPQPAAPAGPAPTPPMGWNSWDAYGFTITEAQFRANVARLAAIRRFGWRYAVVDEGWYMANPLGTTLAEKAYRLDGNGRLIPVPDRFPSATDGGGLKPLADWTHAQGLKFGIHIVRGIPKAAVAANAPIAGSSFHAADAADPASPCPWDEGNVGVADNAAGQAWYDALLKQYAGWGVDLLKVDCIADHPWRPSEVRQIGLAVRRAGRPMVVSLSPGPSSLANEGAMAASAQMWRIMDDLWDGWSFPKPFPNGVRNAFDSLARWAGHVGPDRWPDADMLPIAPLRPHPGWQEARDNRLTPDEKRTAMTLWAIARSPLILGGNLTEMDAATQGLLTNPAVIALNQQDREAHPLPAPDEPGVRLWTSAPRGRAPDTIAAFNLTDAALTVDLPARGRATPARDLWTGARIAPGAKVTVPAHGVALLRLD